MPYIGRDTDKISNVEVLDNITFDGSSSYTLQKGGSNFTPSSANTLLLSIDGVVQAGNFTVSGSTIDFGTAVAGTSTCDFILHYGIGLISIPADGSVTSAKLASGVGGVAGITSSADATAITIDSNENVGIGTSSPQNKLDISATTWNDGLTIKNTGSFNTAIIADANRTSADTGILNLASKWNGTEVAGILFQTGSDTTNKDDGEITFRTASAGTPIERMRIDNSGNLKFNSNFGSVGTAYGVRAWVVFDGNNGSILEDGNVSSVTRFGTGNYRVNFSNNMPDINYSVTGSTVGNNYGTRETFLTGDGGLKTTGYANVQVHDRGSSFVDNNRVNVNVVR